jgi:hypothetical protein
MTTSKKKSSMQANSDEAIIPSDLGYERERFRNVVHQAVLEKFLEESEKSGFSRAQMSRRLRKKPEQITRWLGAPGNWTLDTVTDLMLAMRLDPASLLENVTLNNPSNYAHELTFKMIEADAVKIIRKLEAGKQKISRSVTDENQHAYGDIAQHLANKSKVSNEDSKKNITAGIANALATNRKKGSAIQ